MQLRIVSLRFVDVWKTYVDVFTLQEAFGKCFAKAFSDQGLLVMARLGSGVDASEADR